MSVRNPSSRSRSIRRSIRTQRSEDTISNSLNSYSISDPERLVYIFKNRTNKIIFFFLNAGFFSRFYEDGDRARNSKRSVPKSLHIPSQYPETEITPQKLQEQQQSLDGSNQYDKLFFFFYAFSVILINCILKPIIIGIRKKKLGKTNPRKSPPLLPDLPEVLE